MLQRDDGLLKIIIFFRDNLDKLQNSVYIIRVWFNFVLTVFMVLSRIFVI